MAQSPGGGTSDQTFQTTASGTKRLFSKRASKDLPDYNGSHVDQHPEDIGDSDSHLEKRPRNSEWPLKSNAVGNGTLPEHRRQRSTSQSRASRFVEGSMNDRASQKPHLSYTGDLEASVQQRDGKQITSGHDRKKQRSHGKAHAAKNSLVPPALGDEAEVTRPSGIFRFGRSLAAAFNPSSWKIWSKQQQEGAGRDKIHGSGPPKVEDRHNSNGIRNLRSSATKSQTDIRVKHTSFSKHDSGIGFANHNVLEDLGRLRPSKEAESAEEKRYGRVFEEYPIVSQWAHDQDRAHGENPKLADLPLQSRKSSLPNIHMVYKHRKLSDHPDNMLQPNGLRRLPSRKDLQKQQKLVKRVSDLEGRLEAARRQLAEALGEPIPEQASELVRSRFTPGALASLPSERLLGAYAAEESDHSAIDATDASPGIGKALSAEQRAETGVKEEQVEDLEVEKPMPHTNVTARCVKLKIVNSVESSDMQSWNTRPTENTQPTQAALDLPKGTPSAPKRSRHSPGKRKSDTFGPADDGDAYKPSTESDDGSSVASKMRPPKRKPASRPRKMQKTDPETKTPSRAPSAGQVTQDNSPSHGRNVPPLKKKHLMVRRAYSSPSRGRTLSRGHPSPRDEESRVGIGLDAFTADEMPPVPKLPMGVGAVGLEVAAMVATTDEATPREGEATSTEGARDVQESKGDTGKEKVPFEWPEDVF